MSIEMFDFVLEQLVADADLQDAHCELFHTKDDPAENHPAVDYLCHQFGLQLPDGDFVADTEIRIPVCQDCVNALCGDEWILFYCVGCGASRWVNRRLSQHEYPKNTHVIGFEECPECRNDVYDHM